MLDPFDKQQEAEADAVGQMICAKIGMNPGEFAASLASFLNKTAGKSDGKPVTPEDLSDGELIEGAASKDIQYFLFARETHPSNQEREMQGSLLSKPLKSYFDAKATIYQEWNDDYPSLAKRMSLLALAPAPPPMKTKSGLILARPEASCTRP